MWAQSGAATAGEGMEDITLIIMTHPMHFLASVAQIDFFNSHLIIF